MNRIMVLMTLMAIIESCLFVGNAFCADWKFYGKFTTAPDIQNVLFYDSSTITKSNNSIKLWVKIVLHSEINKCLENKSVNEKAAKKIANGYRPPITKINDKIADTAYLEEAANESTVKSKAEILYQIVCDQNKYRKISGFAFNNKGVLDQRFGISTWEDIASESNAENLAKILCEAK